MLVLEHDDFNKDNPEATEIQKNSTEQRLFRELENICSVSKVFYSNSCSYNITTLFLRKSKSLTGERGEV